MLWPVVNKENPCPICGKTDWCAVGDHAIKCMRIESDHACSSGGWYHKMGTAVPKLRPLPPRATSPSADFTKLHYIWRMHTDSEMLNVHAKSLGVSCTALLALQAGWAPQYDAWAFPMRDSAGKIIGIRLRKQDGQKWTVKDSRSGLFYDDMGTFDGSWKGKTAFVCEGPTDTAAGLTIGLDMIGKPSAGACNELLCDFVKRLKPRECVILADRDSKINPQTGQPFNVGLIEARKLKELLPVRTLICPPPMGFKDLRDFVRAGGNRPVLESIIHQYLWK